MQSVIARIGGLGLFHTLPTYHSANARFAYIMSNLLWKQQRIGKREISTVGDGFCPLLQHFMWVLIGLCKSKGKPFIAGPARALSLRRCSTSTSCSPGQGDGGDLERQDVVGRDVVAPVGALSMLLQILQQEFSIVSSISAWHSPYPVFP
jgi:hypothetical protein